MSTRALAVKRALRDRLAAMELVTRDAVQVTYGFPTRSPERRWAVVGEINYESAEWATNRSRTEVFTVAVIFSVQVVGGTSEQAEEYAIALAEEFEEALKADPSIGGLCITSGYMPRVLRSWPIDGAYEAQFETVVQATCRP